MNTIKTYSDPIVGLEGGKGKLSDLVSRVGGDKGCSEAGIPYFEDPKPQTLNPKPGGKKKT